MRECTMPFSHNRHTHTEINIFSLFRGSCADDEYGIIENLIEN